MKRPQNAHKFTFCKLHINQIFQFLGWYFVYNTNINYFCNLSTNNYDDMVEKRRIPEIKSTRIWQTSCDHNSWSRLHFKQKGRIVCKTCKISGDYVKLIQYKLKSRCINVFCTHIWNNKREARPYIPWSVGPNSDLLSCPSLFLQEWRDGHSVYMYAEKKRKKK